MSSNFTHLNELDPSDVVLDLANQITQYANNSYFERGAGLQYEASADGSELRITARADDQSTKVFYVSVRSHQ